MLITPLAAGSHLRLNGRACREIPETRCHGRLGIYEKPKLERMGTLRELTLAGGEFTPGDSANPYHRYAP